MAEAQAAKAADQTSKKPAAPKVPLTGKELVLKRALRRRLKTEHRKKLSAKLQSDKEFAKTYFAARSKRALEKKSTFRKKKSKKK